MILSSESCDNLGCDNEQIDHKLMALMKRGQGHGIGRVGGSIGLLLELL